MKILTDHTSEIKYIDYNPRLNLLIDYALDGYINLYTMPTLKLILSIQIKDFDYNLMKENINYIFLISNPFPIICCITQFKIFIFDINGEFINELNINSQEIKINIDEDCGLYNDNIGFSINSKEISVIEEIIK